MKKKTVKNCTRKYIKKAVSCACKVTPVKETPKDIECSSKVTPIKATLESVITNPTILKKPKDPRLPAVGTKFVKHFKGRDLEIEVTAEGLVWEGKLYKSLSGLAMAITEYPISGYVFFHKEILEWQTK